MSQEKSLKVLQVQNLPVHKDPVQSMKNASKMIEKYTAEDQIELLIFPELSFSGYFFHNSQDIAPYLENNNEGPTFTWCSAQAKRLGCYVACSYPEKDRHNEGVNYLAQMVVIQMALFLNLTESTIYGKGLITNGQHQAQILNQ